MEMDTDGHTPHLRGKIVMKAHSVYSPPISFPPQLFRLRMAKQIHCRNRRGGNRHGKKVTGLAFVETAQLRHRRQPPGDPSLVPALSAAQGGARGAEDGMMAGGVDVSSVSDGQRRGGKADSMSAQYSLLSTTNDSRLRVYDLDNFAMVCAACNSV